MNQFAADPLFNKTLQAFDSDSLKSLFLNVFEVNFKLYRLAHTCRFFFFMIPSRRTIKGWKYRVSRFSQTKTKKMMSNQQKYNRCKYRLFHDL